MPRRSGLGGLERGAEPDGDEGVLHVGAAARVGVDVAGGDGGHAEAAGEGGEPAVAGAVVSPVGALELDPQVGGAEGVEQPAGVGLGGGQVAALPVAGDEPVAGAAGEADQALGVLGDALERDPGLLGAALVVVAGVRVGGGEQPAEVAIAGRRLAEQGEVGEPVGPAERDGQLGAGDALQPEAGAGLGELHRPPDPVMVGDREGPVAELGRGGGKLERGGGAVEKREGRVGMELGVGGRRGAFLEQHTNTCSYIGRTGSSGLGNRCK